MGEGEYGGFIPVRHPFDGEAFSAGHKVGQIVEQLRFLAPLGAVLKHYVDPRLVEQLDLLAMSFGYSVSSEPWEAHPDEWTLVTFTPGDGEARSTP